MSPLHDKLDHVEWGEYRLGDLFEINSSKKRFDANKVEILGNGVYPYIVRMGSNNGQRGFLNEDTIFLNQGNTISFGQDTATMFYQENPYFTGDKIKILQPRYERFSEKNAQFFILVISRAFSSFSWGASSFNIKIIENTKIHLPTRNGQPDFDFMDRFVAEIEAERMAQMDEYLSATGLYDCVLTDEEIRVLENFESGKVEFGGFSYASVFNKITQGRRLKKEDQIDGDIPFVMAGTTNTGVVNYISNPVASFPKNSITVDIFGNTFYRSYGFGAGDDTGVYWNDQKNYSKEMMLFFASSMSKGLYGKFDFGKKLRSSQSIGFEMQLPTLNNQPHYDLMQTLISAVQKLVIRDVVAYTERKIATTRDIVKKQ